LVSACASIPGLGQGSDRDTTKPTILSETGRLGGRGIEVKFVEGSPPNEIYLDIPFDVKLELKNWASKEISGSIQVSDTFTGGLSAIQEERSFTLEGIDNERNTPKSVPFRFSGDYIYGSENIKETDVIVTTKYNYEVILFTPICVRADNALVDTNSCRSQETFSGANLGKDATHAPVTVTNIVKRLVPSSDDSVTIILEMTFQDFGGVSSGIDNQDNSLDISGIVQLEGQGFFNCNKNTLKFKPNSKTHKVVCQLSANLPQDTKYFKNPLTIELNYPYKSRVGKSIKVLDLSKQSGIKGF
tara:strand:- start:3230 stop:4132 length:903 start_codon:yes stop_codon:yes gene_type:complete